MIKLLTIIGARPQIIKAAAISRAIKNGFTNIITEKILHTGQHYDANMSRVFFDELGIPLPDYNLNIGSGLHGEQTAKMISEIEKVLLTKRFDGVILYGDTNSTLAGAIAASKLHIPIFHIEAGLRSYNMGMPEEVNRIVCDQLSSILFAPTCTAVGNLRKEGYEESPAVFSEGRKRKICNSGDIMYDNSMYYAEIADVKSTILFKNKLTPGKYVLTTIHRNNNTDSSTRLSTIFNALIYISQEFHTKVVLPIHPRTLKLMEASLSKEILNEIQKSENLLIIPPVSYLDMICLEKNASMIITDSGGVQKEAFFFEKPCIILRGETEWVEIINNKAGILVDADESKIISAYNELLASNITFINLFGNGQASEVILSEIVSYFNH